jgi:hypothetical protein
MNSVYLSAQIDFVRENPAARSMALIVVRCRAEIIRDLWSEVGRPQSIMRPRIPYIFRSVAGWSGCSYRLARVVV